MIAHHLVHELEAAQRSFDLKHELASIGGRVQVLRQLGRDSRLTLKPASISATNDAGPLR